MFFSLQKVPQHLFASHQHDVRDRWRMARQKHPRLFIIPLRALRLHIMRFQRNVNTAAAASSMERINRIVCLLRHERHSLGIWSLIYAIGFTASAISITCSTVSLYFPATS